MQVLMNRPVTFTKPASNSQTSIFPRTLREYLIFSMLRKLTIRGVLLRPRLTLLRKIIGEHKKNGFDVKVKKRARVCFQH